MKPVPALYVGTVRHRRFHPRPHRFTYTLFMAFLDVDALADQMAVSRLTGYNRWNWAAFFERDHFGDPSLPLRVRVTRSARSAGISVPDGPMFLLTHLRYAGYVFNPISFFYCYDHEGTVKSVLAEVDNTYGGRHLYWLSPDVRAASGTLRAVTAKQLYVSPFMPVALDYEFVLTSPGAGLVAHMNVDRSDAEADGPSRLFDATLTLERRPWTAAEIRSALVRYPLMTTKVIAAIHWEALRLHRKGVPPIPRRVANGVGERGAEAEARGAAADGTGALHETPAAPGVRGRARRIGRPSG